MKRKKLFQFLYGKMKQRKSTKKHLLIKLVCRINRLSRIGLAGIIPGKYYHRGRLSTIDLLVLTHLDQTLFKIENII
jgi:hypothetical protein